MHTASVYTRPGRVTNPEKTVMSDEGRGQSGCFVIMTFNASLITVAARSMPLENQLPADIGLIDGDRAKLIDRSREGIGAQDDHIRPFSAL